MRALRWFALTFSTIMVLDIIFDCGKWALGRYTVVSPLISALTIVGFSALLAAIVEVIHTVRRRRERQYEQYLHHKAKVWVACDQKSHHWDSSLCPDCASFFPDTMHNCLIESVVHTMNRDNHLVSVIWECPKFKRRGKG